MENFDEIVLSCTVKAVEANLCFCSLGKNLKIQNGCHFWGEKFFLKIAKGTLVRYHRSKISTKSLLSGTVKEIEANLWFSIFGKKFKMAAIFGEGKIFGKLPIVHFLDTLLVENFDKIALTQLRR